MIRPREAFCVSLHAYANGCASHSIMVSGGRGLCQLKAEKVCIPTGGRALADLWQQLNHSHSVIQSAAEEPAVLSPHSSSLSPRFSGRSGLFGPPLCGGSAPATPPLLQHASSTWCRHWRQVPVRPSLANPRSAVPTQFPVGAGLVPAHSHPKSGIHPRKPLSSTNGNRVVSRYLLIRYWAYAMMTSRKKTTAPSRFRQANAR